MRYTKRERYLAGFAALMAIAAVTLLGLYLLRGHDQAPGTANRAAGSRPPATGPSTTAQPGSAGPRTLTAGYRLGGRWSGGFNAELVVTNLGSQPVEGWTVRLQMPGDVVVSGAWSADATQVASAVTLRSLPWNTYLAPGAAVHLGFQATGNAAEPKSCTVNGAPC